MVVVEVLAPATVDGDAVLVEGYRVPVARGALPATAPLIAPLV